MSFNTVKCVVLTLHPQQAKSSYSQPSSYSRTELSLRQKRGEKHLTIKDGEIITAPRSFLWRSAVTITIGGQNPPTLRL